MLRINEDKTVRIDERFSGAFWRFVSVLPLALPTGLAVLSIVLMSLLVSERFESNLILIFSLLTVVPALYFVFKRSGVKRPGSKKEKRLFDVLILLFVIIWAGFNFGYVARSVFIDRDPGIYTVAGKWLVDNKTTNIPIEYDFHKEEGFVAHEGGMWHGPSGTNYLQPQGKHLLPALLGVAGRIGGGVWIFRTNVIIGAVALLAVFAFARLIMKPRWAGVATVILGTTLPFIYFSRDTYTEPLMAAFIFVSLALLYEAYKKLPKVIPVLWAVAGITAGASVLARPEGYLTLIILAGFLTLVTLATKPKYKNKLLLASSIFLAGALISVLPDWLDRVRLSYSYSIGPAKIIRPQLLVLTGLILAGLGLIFIDKKTSKVKKIYLFIKKRGAYWVSGAFVAGFLILMSRPLWLKVMFPKFGYSAGATTSLQSALGLPKELRKYSENSVEWLSWYIGWVVIGLAIVGITTAIIKAIKKDKLGLLAGVLIVSSMTAIYLITPKITPDHVWASRRFLPVAIPGLAVFGMYALSVVWDFIKVNTNKFKKGLLFLAISMFLIMQPLFTTRPFVAVAEKENNYQALSSFCNLLPDNAIVLWIDKGTLALSAVISTRAYCDVSSVGYVKKENQKSLLSKEILSGFAQKAARQNLTPILAIFGSDIEFIDSSITDPLSTVVGFEDKMIEKTLVGPPKKITTKKDTIMAGLIGGSGEITALTTNY